MLIIREWGRTPLRVGERLDAPVGRRLRQVLRPVNLLYGEKGKGKYAVTLLAREVSWFGVVLILVSVK